MQLRRALVVCVHVCVPVATDGPAARRAVQLTTAEDSADVGCAGDLFSAADLPRGYILYMGRNRSILQCADGYGGSPAVRCRDNITTPASTVWLSFSGCEENHCERLGGTTVLARTGYAVSNDLSATTVSDLGRVRCADGWVRASPWVAPTAQCLSDSSAGSERADDLHTLSAFEFRGCVPRACARTACSQPVADSCLAASACTVSTAPFCATTAPLPSGSSCYDGTLYGRCQSDGSCVARVHIVSQITLEVDIRTPALSLDALTSNIGSALSTILSSSGVHCVPDDFSLLEWQISYGNLVLDYSVSVNSVEATPARLAAASAAINDPALVHLPSDTMSVSWNDTNVGRTVHVLSSQGRDFRTLAWHRNVSMCDTDCGSRYFPERIYDTYFCTEDGATTREPSTNAADSYPFSFDCLAVIGDPPQATSRLCAVTKPCCEDVGPIVGIQSPEKFTTRTSSALRLDATISWSHCEFRYSVRNVGTLQSGWSAPAASPRTRITWTANYTDDSRHTLDPIAAATALDTMTQALLNAETRDRTRLHIPPFALAPDSTIAIECTAYLEWTEPGRNDRTATLQRSSTSSASVFITAERSPQVFAQIAGGSLRRVETSFTPLQMHVSSSAAGARARREVSLVLDGRQSSDPDVPAGDAVVWDRIEWACWNRSAGGISCWDDSNSPQSHSNATSITANLTGGRNSTAVVARMLPPSLLWNISSYLGYAATLEISLTVARGGRSDTTTVDVEIMDGPLLYKLAIDDVLPVYSTRGKIVLSGVVELSQAATVPVADVGLNWSGVRLLPNGGKRSIDLAAISSTRVRDAVLVIRPDVLLPGATYRFTLHASDTVTPLVGIRAVDIVTNAFDIAGVLSVEPEEGMAVTDVFNLRASEFIDSDLPLHHSFIQFAETFREFGGDRKGRMLTEASLSNQADVLLIQGDSTHDYMTLVCAQVTDMYGQTAEAEATVTVWPFHPTGTRLAAAVERLEKIEDSDIVQTIQVVSALAADMSCCNESDIGYRAPNTDFNVDDLTDRIQTLARLADELMKVSSIIGKEDNLAHLAILIDALRIVTEDSTLLSQSSAKSTISAVEFITTGTSPQLMLPEEHVANIAKTVSNLLQKAATVLFTGANASVGEQFGMSVMRIITHLGKLIAESVVVGEDPVAIDVPLFVLSAQKNYASKFEGAPLPLPTGINDGRSARLSIFVPTGVFDSLNQRDTIDRQAQDHVVAHVVAWKHINPYFWAPTAVMTDASAYSVGRRQYRSKRLTQELGTAVLGLTFRYDQAQGGDEIDLRDIPTPIAITLQGHNISAKDSEDGDLVAYCGYWSATTNAWVIDEIAGIGERSERTGEIACNYSHLTDFAAFNGMPVGFGSICTSGCWTRLWFNKAATMVVLAFGLGLLITWFAATKYYCQHHHELRHLNFQQSAFAHERRRVFNPDQTEHTSSWEDSKHRLRHDYTFGGILFALHGDPYDRWQRAVVVVTAAIVNLCVSLFFPAAVFSDLLDGPQCNETMDIGVECSHDADDEISGESVIITALISVIIVYPLERAFVWLRQPIVRTVENPASIYQVGACGVVIALAKACARRGIFRAGFCRGCGETDQRTARNARTATDEGYEAAQGVIQRLKDVKAVKTQNSAANVKLCALAHATGHHWILPPDICLPATSVRTAWMEEAPQRRFGLTVTVVAARIHGLSDSISTGAMGDLRPYARVTVIEQDRNDARKLVRRTTSSQAAPLTQAAQSQSAVDDYSMKRPEKQTVVAHRESPGTIDRRMQAIDMETVELTRQLDDGNVSAQQSEENAAKWKFTKAKLEARVATLANERTLLRKENQLLELAVAVPDNLPQLRASYGNDQHGTLNRQKLSGAPRQMAETLDEAGLLRTCGHKYAASARKTLSVSIAQQTQALAEELSSPMENASNLDRADTGTGTGTGTVYEALWYTDTLGKSEDATAVARGSTTTAISTHGITCRNHRWTSGLCCHGDDLGADSASKYQENNSWSQSKIPARADIPGDCIVTATGETLWWDMVMRQMPRVRIRLWNESAGEFLGECELQLPLDPKHFPGSEVQKLGTDWRWPSSSAQRLIGGNDADAEQQQQSQTGRMASRMDETPQDCCWFALRASSVTGLPDSLSDPLQPPIPQELQALAALMHESSDLLTASSKECKIVAATQLVKQAEGTLDKKVVKQAKRIQQLHKHAKRTIAVASPPRGQNDKNDCFRGSDVVDWLLFVLVTNQGLRESVTRHLKQRKSVSVAQSDDSTVVHVQLPGSMKERHKAVAVGKLLLKHRVIVALDNGYSDHFVDSNLLLYRLCPHREYIKRGELAIRIGWAQENTLAADRLRTELMQLARQKGVIKLREHVLGEGVSRGRVSNIMVELTQVRGLVDQRAICREETHALIELLVAHRYGTSSTKDVWEPFAWSEATKLSTANPRQCLIMFGVTVVGSGMISGLGLLIVALYAPNLSVASLWLWLQTALLSFVFQEFLLEPASILLEAIFLQCVEGDANLRGVIEAQVYEMQQY